MTTSHNEISVNFVDATWLEIGNTEDEDLIMELSSEFSSSQPSLSEFILASVDDLSEDAKELGYYIGFVAWRCYAGFYESRLGEVSTDEIVERAEQMEASISDVEEDVLEDISVFSSQESHLWQYIVDTVLEEHEDMTLTEDEKASLLATLKIHTDCLSAAVAKTIH